METQHTQEPWMVNPEGVGPCVIGNADRIVGECSANGTTQTMEDKHNARRIVACVNACAGVPIEVLETPGAVRVLPNEPHKLAEHHGDESMRTTLRVIQQSTIL